jgi:hypothetical protein
MSRTSLEKIADSVRRVAQRDGFVLPRQVRAELTEAGLDDGQWKDVVALVGPSLNYRNGRYYYVPPGSPRMRVRVRRDQRHHQVIDRAVRRLIRLQRAAEAVMIERRSARRINYVAPVEVRTADRRVLRFLTREMSVTGIRLIGTSALQGQKVHLWVPRPDRAEESHGFVVQVLWSSEVGDGLFENGGVFVDMVTEEDNSLTVVGGE